MYKIIAILVIFEEIYWFLYSAARGNTICFYGKQVLPLFVDDVGVDIIMKTNGYIVVVPTTYICCLSKTEMRRSDLEERFTTVFSFL